MNTETDIGYIVRKMESDWKVGNTQISDYVSFDINKTLNKIDAYLNSKQITGDVDSLGRKKPFFNIVVAASNIWYRATDIDRKNIKINGTNSKNYIIAFIAMVLLRNWMRKNSFGLFINKWGRVLSQYGSAITKFVETADGLSASVVPWNRVICDAISFEGNPQIEILEFTEAQLRGKIEYDQDMVEALLNARTTRETTSGVKKDNKSDYYRLYEVHGNFSKALYKKSKGKEPTESDRKTFVKQMYVISYVETGKKGEFDEFILFSGVEDDPYLLTHLIEEDGRVLAKGAVESLFEPQWMMNHSMKSALDQLDLASKTIFQTSDASFVGQNVLTAIENGDILIHKINEPLTAINNSAQGVPQVLSFGNLWKGLSNEITGISESMLGNTAPSGTAWRQIEALLKQNESLFELMRENKGLYMERIIRERVIPSLKKTLNSADEISAILEDHELQMIDSVYIPREAAKRLKKKSIDSLVKGKMPEGTMQSEMANVQSELDQLGNTRYFKPSELGAKTWKEVMKNFDWNDIIVDVTQEEVDTEALTTITTMMQTIGRNPAMLNDPNFKMLWNKALSITGTVSPIEMRRVPSPVQPQLSPPQATVGQ